jgi:hypothetical protein
MMHNVLSTVVQQQSKILSGLPDKLLIDTVNSIEVSKDHIRVQKTRSGFLSRVTDGLSGKGHLRQTEINQSLSDSLEGVIEWTTYLTNELAHSTLAIAKANEKISVIHENVATLAHYSADTRQQLKALDQRLSEKYQELSDEIKRVDIEQKASRQLDQVFDAWKAGKLKKLPIIQQLFVILDNLFWGDFGYYCQTHRSNTRNNFLSQLDHKIQIELNDLLKPSEHRFSIQQLTPQLTHSLNDALAYQGDWSCEDQHPFSFTATQQPILLETSLHIPRLLSVERVSNAFVDEFFNIRAVS